MLLWFFIVVVICVFEVWLCDLINGLLFFDLVFDLLVWMFGLFELFILRELFIFGLDFLYVLILKGCWVIFKVFVEMFELIVFFNVLVMIVDFK